LIVQRLPFLLKILTPALILSKHDDSTEVSFRQSVDLLDEASMRLPDVLAPRLEFLRQPLTPMRACECLGNALWVG
jgi:hypothetical protein